MKYSSKFLNELVEKSNIYDVASKFYKFRKVGATTYSCICPDENHNEKTGSFIINISNNLYYCFGCGVSGNTLSFLTHYVFNDNFIEAVKYLANELNIALPVNKKEEQYLARMKRNAKDFYASHTDISAQYLLDRGLEEEDVDEWLLGYDSVDHKITFPLFNSQKQVIGITFRWIVMPVGANDKYKNPANGDYFNKSNYYYGCHLVDSKKEFLYITEGYMDVIMAHKYGLGNTVGTLSTAFTDYHLKYCIQKKLKPVFLYDNDETGLKGIHKACNICLKEGIDPYLVILPHKDLCDTAIDLKEGLSDYITSHTVSYQYYLIEEMMKQYTKAKFELNQMYIPKFIDNINKLPEKEKKSITYHILNVVGLDLREMEDKKDVKLRKVPTKKYM